MINYYKILGIENYSSVTEVKEAYKEKIKIYHPDISSLEDAEEMTKYLNLAKTHLDNQADKEVYDRKLKLAYLIEIKKLKSTKTNTKHKSENSYWNSLSREERKEKLDESKKIKIREKYNRGLNKFPLSLRILGIVVILLWSVQLIYSHYFIRFGSLDYLIAMFGYLMLAAIIVASANEAYTFFIVKSLYTPIRFNFEKRIGAWFVLSFFVVVIGINGLNSFRKQYHLQNHSNYTVANILLDESYGNKIVVKYEVGGEEYLRQLKVEIYSIVLLPNNNTVIRYAEVDPKICELVMADEKID